MYKSLTKMYDSKTTVPFFGVSENANQTRKAIPDDGQVYDIVHALGKILKGGGNGRPARKDYIANSQIALLLNAYNTRAPNTMQSPWAYFHRNVIKVPHRAPPGFDWNQRAYRLQMPRGDDYRDNFNRDLTRVWPTIAGFGVARPNRHDIRYRLLCFIHEHDDTTNTADFFEKVYSMSVYDREVSLFLVYFHSPECIRPLCYRVYVVVRPRP